MTEQSLKDKTEIMQYAPVLIPTLNRYEHFKRCLESLEKCTGADKTEVYVGLDYPPAEKYVEGWKKIDDYLKGREQNNGFAKLIVNRRDHNLGINGENSNYMVMYRELPPDTESYIVTEDDNEFSPCFLDFMNKALEKYRDNPKVYSVCGFTQPEYEVKGMDVIFIYDNSAWGFGRWTNREKPTLDYVKAKLHSPRALLKVWRAYPAIIRSMLTMVNKDVLYGDAAYTLKCICEEIYQIRPSFSLVRNTGDDGSGQHSTKSGVFSAQKISDAVIFDFPDTLVPMRTTKIDRNVRLNMSPKSKMRRFKNDITILRDLIKYWTNSK